MSQNNFLPYAKHLFGGGEIEAVLNVLENGWISRGPLVLEFENKIAEMFEYKSVCACSTGSSALDIVVNSLSLSHTSEIIVPTLSWPATASCVMLAGAKVVFADIDPNTYCISPESIESKITQNTVAIIVVHFAGYPCDMEAIWSIAENNNLFVIEDAAHAFGGCYFNGKSIGSSYRSYASTFSFHPAKNMTTAEGGLIVTSSEELGGKFRIARSGGVMRIGSEGIEKAKYQVLSISSNYHLSELHAAIGITQLNHLKSFISSRRRLYKYYLEKLKEFEGVHLALPSYFERSAFNLFVIRVLSCSNERLISYLNNQGIGAYYHYPLLNHCQIYNVDYENLETAEQYSSQAVSLPLGPHLDVDDVDRVVQSIKSFFN